MSFAVDNFNRPNASNLGPSWSSQTSLSLLLRSNQCAGPGIGFHAPSFWNHDAFVPAQYSQVRIINCVSPGSDFIYVTVRASSILTNINYYSLRTDLVSSKMFKVINGIETELLNIGVTYSLNDIMKLTIDNSHILRAYKNGTQIGINQASGSQLLFGQPGIDIHGAESTAILDNWEGGDALVSDMPFVAHVGATRVRVRK